MNYIAILMSLQTFSSTDYKLDNHSNEFKS